MSKEVFVVSLARTPIGRFGGSFKNTPPTDLGAHAMKAAIERAGVSGADLDLYIFGNVLRAGHGQLLPRQAALKAGIPDNVDGYAVDMVCSSGMMSVMNAAMTIRAGEADLVLAGGMESMSQAAFALSSRARWGYKFLLGNREQVKDLLLYDGLTDPINGEAMGEETERLIAELGVSRGELDEVAYQSHKRAAEATEAGIFMREIAPYEIKTRKGVLLLDTDEGIRPETTADSLAALRPAFKKDGVLTAGNSRQISDGAAALLLADAEAVEKYGLEPIARIMGGTWAAGPSWRFPEAPVPAIKKLLDKLGMSLDDFDLFENNEAFALNSVLLNRMLGVPYEKMNVLGGAIALGHPIGASGARIIGTLLTALEAKGGQRGIAALCHGTGGATAVAVERV